MSKLVSILLQPYLDITIEVSDVERVYFPADACDWQKAREAAQWVRVTGTVIQGGNTSRLGAHSSFRDMTGQTISEEMPPEAFERGEYRRAAG